MRRVFLRVLPHHHLLNVQMVATGGAGRSAAVPPTPPPNDEVTTSRVWQPEPNWAFSVAGGDDMRLSVPACEVNPARYSSRSMRSILV